MQNMTEEKRERIVQAIRDSGEYQREIARRSGVSETLISQIKRGHVGEVTTEVMLRLEMALGLDTTETLNKLRPA